MPRKIKIIFLIDIITMIICILGTAEFGVSTISTTFSLTWYDDGYYSFMTAVSRKAFFFYAVATLRRIGDCEDHVSSSPCMEEAVAT